MPKRVAYCPRNGCGMANGAAPPCPVVCKNCGFAHTNRDKVCPRCKRCQDCGRIGKRFYGFA